MRLLFLAVAVLATSLSAPVGAHAADEEFPVYTGDQFKALYDHAVEEVLPNLASPGEPGPVTGNADLDARIWDLAFDRGYVLRPVAAGPVGSADGVRMQPQAAAAWVELKAAARLAGYQFVVSSAYRSPASQRTQFLSKLNGTSDRAIDATLTWYSLPGTSKHHSGYALDFRYRDGTFGEFRSTPDYAWLAADNFAIPKSFGFIPSYPDDVEEQGPNPEPWEFVWVGTDLIACGVPAEMPGRLSGPAAAIAEEVSLCPGSNAAEGVTAIPLWLTRLSLVFE
ncbi:MAG: M15 family metallopeptidase [Acidimicrobiia bacterium]